MWKMPAHIVNIPVPPTVPRKINEKIQKEQMIFLFKSFLFMSR